MHDGLVHGDNERGEIGLFFDDDLNYASLDIGRVNTVDLLFHHSHLVCWNGNRHGSNRSGFGSVGGIVVGKIVCEIVVGTFGGPFSGVGIASKRDDDIVVVEFVVEEQSSNAKGVSVAFVSAIDAHGAEYAISVDTVLVKGAVVFTRNVGAEVVGYECTASHAIGSASGSVFVLEEDVLVESASELVGDGLAEFIDFVLHGLGEGRGGDKLVEAFHLLVVESEEGGVHHFRSNHYQSTVGTT